MNSNDKTIAETKTSQIGLLSLLLSIIFLVFSYLGVGFTTNDDTRYEIWVYKELFLNTNDSLAIDVVTFQGRITSFLSYYLFTFPHRISKILGLNLFNLINLTSLAASVSLFSWCIYKVVQQKLFSLFIAVFFIISLQNSWSHNVLTSYTFSMNTSISLLLVSLNIFLMYLSSHKPFLWILSNLIFLLTLFISYEFFLFYVAIFIFIAFYNIKPITTSNHAALLATFYTLLPYFISIIVFLIAYLTCKYFCPPVYEGLKVTNFSFFNTLRVIYQYTISSFPTYMYFHYSNLFNAYSDVVQGHSYTIGNFFEQLKAEWLVKSIVVSYFVYMLLENRLVVISNKMFKWLLIASIYLMLVPNLLVAITGKYQQWVKNGDLLYTTTYFSYFGTVLLIVSGIVFFNQFFYKRTSVMTLLRKCYIWFIVMVIAFISLVTDYSNYYVFKEQKISQQKWNLIDKFVTSNNFNAVPSGSFIYAPSLWEHRNSVVYNHSNYWTQYLTFKYNKNVTVSSSLKELKHRLVNQDFNNLYYLKFSQEQKDMHQFILFAKVQKVIQDNIFLSSEAAITSNSNHKVFLVFGLLDGSFFSAHIDKQQTREKYTTTNLKAIEGSLFDLESVSMSYYTDHRLYKIGNLETN